MRKTLVALVLFCMLFITTASAEVLLLNLNKVDYITGESAQVFGYVLDDNLNAANGTSVTIKLGSTTLSTETANADGYYQYYIANLTAGSYTVTATTASSTKSLPLTVSSSASTYTIIASSLNVPISNPLLSFTVKKYTGGNLTSDSYSYIAYYENGSQYASGTGTSNVAKNLTLPAVAGLYTVTVDSKMSFTVGVTQFTMKFKITDKAGSVKEVFKPNGIAYFEVEGFSSGQKLSNATVTARVTDPAGAQKTVTFRESNKVYKGNTNVTQTSAIQLRSGDYSVEFFMKDSSNNMQKVKGYFSVKGLDVAVRLVEKRPYQSGDVAEFDVTVKNLETGTLVPHSEITYSYVLKSNGKFYDVTINAANDTDTSLSSVLNFTIPSGLNDGEYFLMVKASANSKKGEGKEFFQIMNTQVFVELTDNYGGFRDIFKPGEMARIAAESDENLSQILLFVEKNGVTQSNYTENISGSQGELTFNVPTTVGDYLAKITVLTSSGERVKQDIWFRVQNYFSWLDVKDLNNNFQFIHASGDSFLTEINVFDIATGNSVDISSFVVKFDKVVNEDTQVEYTNIQTTLNSTYSSQSTGRVVYNFVPPALPNGFYRVEYTLVSTTGKSLKGKGWFGISDIQVSVYTYDTSGLDKKIFSAGDTINVTVVISTSGDGTATLHRDFFDPQSFSITGGIGSTLLTAAQNELPSEQGFYGFGAEVVLNTGEEGLGNGFFEIRNLNFRSITVRSNGRFDPGDDISADVVIEKSGSLVNQTNVTLARLIRVKDHSEISANSTANLTGNLGRTTINISAGTLQPGDYFAELKAKKGANIVYEGFGFQVVEDKVTITINDADRVFSSTDTIEVNILVTDQNDNPQQGRTVNLTGLLNLNTWAPVTTKKQANTSSNGVATITLAASNFNKGFYAPIVKVQGLTQTVVGFGDGEFEIKPFSTTLVFSENKESFQISEAIAINVTVTGTVTVTAAVEDTNGNDVSVDYAYSSGVLTLNNNLDPGEYFVDVTITQTTNTVTERLWFEVIAPWMHIEPLMNPTREDDGYIDIIYSVFTFSALGWEAANATVNITYAENLWTGDRTSVGLMFNSSTNASGMGNYTIALSPYTLSKGDYLLHFDIIENSDFDNSLYFRIGKDVNIRVWTTVNESNAVIHVNASGLSTPISVCLQELTNFQTLTTTTYTSSCSTGVAQPYASIGVSADNGFYQAKLKVNDSSQDIYYMDAFFEVWVRAVETEIINAGPYYVGDVIQFNISASNASTFWIINPFTDTVILKQSVSIGNTYINRTFNYAGFFIYGYGDEKWDVFKNSDGIDIQNAGFNIDWPYGGNMYILNGDRNFTFNVTSSKANTSLTLKLRNHFEGYENTYDIGTTHAAVSTQKSFSFNLTSYLGLNNGPHDVELILQDGSTEPPKEFFFIDIFPDQYNIWAWPERWEYKGGELVNIKIEVFDVTNNWQKLVPDNVVQAEFRNPFGSPASGSVQWQSGNDYANISTQGTWATGHYHVELDITEGSVTRRVPFDFYVRGNDNLQLNWWQNKWEYTTSEIFTLQINAKDNGVNAADVPVDIDNFEKKPETWDQEPTNMMAEISYPGAYNFSNTNNKTDSNGDITFQLNIGGANLETGGYSGRVNVGGQIIWFDFNVQTFMVDAYPEEWEYGISDTIEINVRARNLATWNPISADGNVTIKRIERHEPGFWQPTEIDLDAFNLQNSIFTVSDGEALIEMLANSSALLLNKAYEFELKLEMNLSGQGTSEGWAWFRLSNGTKPSAQIVDATGEVPDAFFSDQTYTLEVTNVMNAVLRNMWGPCGKTYNKALIDVSGTYKVNFTAPMCPGWYTMEIEVTRPEGFTEWIYEDFQIGSGTQLDVWMNMGRNVVPGVNFTVNTALFGESDNDPWCHDCQGSWFGPLVNKTILLKGYKDLTNFQFTDLSGMNITEMTQDFPASMFILNTCPDYQDYDSCDSDESCMWMNDHCEANPDDINGDQESYPGDAYFNLHPTILGLTAGKSYDLIFSYTNDDSEEFTNSISILVEQFHVGISRNVDNLGAKTTQYVWLKTTNLYGTAIPNCSIVFDAVYSKKNWQLAKTLSINSQTGANGQLVFTYDTPSLPGDYFVEGTATCNVSNQMIAQDIGFGINVGAKSLEVDMKTKFKEDEHIKISIVTRDRTGLPTSQRLEVNLFHDKDDYPYPIYSLGGSDCTILDANQDWDHYVSSSGGEQVNNRMEVYTGADGKLALELCSMPRGEYMLDIFPMFEFGGPMDDQGFSEGPKEDRYGFFTDFTISDATITIVTNNGSQKYMINDTAIFNITALDEDGTGMNGTIIAADSYLEIENGMSMTDICVYNLKDYNMTIPVVNGQAQLNYTIPDYGVDGDTDENVSLVSGPVDLYVLIMDGAGEKYPGVSLLYTVVSDHLSSMSAPASVKTNSLITVNMTTDNQSRYKAQVGGFFLEDNPSKEKFFSIEGGVFFENIGNNRSSAVFQLLSPKEPGTYILGVPIFPLEVSPQGMAGSTQILMSTIEVTLDLVNISGRITEVDGATPIQGALVQIGKKETYTDSNGDYLLSVPKGKNRVYVEHKTSTQTYFMKTISIDFKGSQDVNMSLYRIVLKGNMSQTVYNISSPSTDISSMKIRMNLSINNTGSQNLTNFTATAMAISGETVKTMHLEPYAKGALFFQSLYPGFETGAYTVKFIMSDDSWNSSSYTLVNGTATNATVGAILKKTYNVYTYAVAGDGLDNDGDCFGFVAGSEWCDAIDDYVWDCTDEEKDNNKDDDCDGKIDEDLAGTTYFEWCGNGFCAANEAGDCFEDCGMTNGYCGDDDCDQYESVEMCPMDCGSSSDMCNETNQCALSGGPQFCNMWGYYEPAPWCQSSCDPDNCWACAIDGTPGSTECEANNCTLGIEGENRWCYENATCGDDNCWACKDQGNCDSQSACEWDWNANDCFRIWSCEYECSACSDMSSCEASTASMDGADCRWYDDPMGPGWCEWNFSDVPAGAGMGGIVGNLWIDTTNMTQDWQSDVDWKCKSGNCGEIIPNGTYYVMVDMGNTDMNLSIDGVFKGVIYNSGGFWQTLSLGPYLLTTGYHSIELQDLIGPDYINWSFPIDQNWTGGSAPPGDEMFIDTVAVNHTVSTTFISFNITLVDLEGSPLCGGSYLDVGDVQEWRIYVNSSADVGYFDSQGKDYDFQLYFLTNETGMNRTGFRDWIGSSNWVENTSISVDYQIDCSNDMVMLGIALTDINASECEWIDYKAETFQGQFGSDSNKIHDMRIADYQIEGSC